VELQDFDGPKQRRKYETIRQFVLSHRALLAKQGCVVQCWRTYRGRKQGPYYRLAFREHGGQRSIYLGRSIHLADRVRALLRDCQARVDEQRALQELREQARKEFKRSRAAWRQELARVGLHLHGNEVRGWRALSRAAESNLLELALISDCLGQGGNAHGQ
jgi:hypothetical protein